MKLCHCGSGSSYGDCCEPVVTGSAVAETAEQLMRARYSAHAEVALDFIRDSIHPDHRHDYDAEESRKWAESSQWLGLEIHDVQQGGAEDQSGQVEFTARYRAADGTHQHRELADFVKQDGRWFFTEGRMAKGRPLRVEKVGRNDPCPCGSGKKYKKCCAA